MNIYFKRADFKFLKGFKNNEFSLFITNTLEIPLGEILKDYNILNRLYTLFNIVTIKKDNKIIGYIWFEDSFNNSILIKEISINPENINDIIESKINFRMYHKFKDMDIFYEGYYYKDFDKIIKSFGFAHEKKSLLKFINLGEFVRNEKESLKKDFKIEHFKQNSDEEVRCFLQNKIFGALDRDPLTVDDIFLDQNQSYYIQNYSIFLKFKDEYIGYGQIIYDNMRYVIVNFGIIPTFRGRGLGRYLLENILKIAKDDGLHKIYIMVDSLNEKAINLYSKSGFIDSKIIYSYNLKET